MTTSNKYFLQTKRLGFRIWTSTDLKLALSLWGDPEVTKWIDARGKLSEKQVEERLTAEIGIEKKNNIQYWPIFLLRTDELVGCCGLRPHNLSQGTYEIGFHIRSKYWRRGYALEAAQEVIKHAFHKLKALALFAGHNPKNEASHKLLEKLGFHYTHDEFYPPTGLDHPSYLLTVDEFKHLFCQKSF